MQSRLRFGLVLLTMLVIPTVALAAPGNVTGITTIVEADGVRVSWQPVTEDVASYRIFYSTQSILDHGGLFDDFEVVDGSVTTHLLRNVPPAQSLTVAVLAVDAQGEESPFFVEEATITLSSSSLPSLETTPSLAPPGIDTDATLHLLQAESLSPTDLLLTFSHAVSVPQDRALEALIIETSGGVRLPLSRVTASGMTLRITTAEQKAGVIYRVRPEMDVTGTDIDGKTIAISPDQMPMLFTGRIPPPLPSPSPQPSPQPSPAAGPDVTDLILRAQPSNGLFTVEATWRAPLQPVVGYELLQTTDGGRTFGAVTTVPPTTTAVRIPGVTPGSFGMFIRAMQADGTRTDGLTHVIDLPGAALTSGPVTGQVQPSPIVSASTEGSGSLPGSGPGVWLLMTLVGSIIGLVTMRKRMHLAAARI